MAKWSLDQNALKWYKRKMFSIHVQRYQSMLKMNGMTTYFFFRCNVGVRQGEKLSLFLFSIYINDLEEFLLDNNVVSLQSISCNIENELLIYFKLLVLVLCR